MHTLKKTFLTLALALAFVSAEAAQNTGRILIPESKLKFKANEDYTEVTITAKPTENGLKFPRRFRAYPLRK